MILDFFRFLFDWRIQCQCCGTYDNTDYFGYSDQEYCYPCAEENGYWSSKWKHECKAKKVNRGK